MLNRLSGDIEKVDRYLPGTFSYFYRITSRVLVAFVIISIISNPLFLVFVGLYFLIVFRMQRHFSSANIELTRLESISKSPFFQLFTDAGNFGFFIFEIIFLFLCSIIFLCEQYRYFTFLYK